MTSQLSILDLIAEGQQKAHEGLARAVDHADRETPGWKERCWTLFLEWLDRMPAGFRFKVEDFRLYVEAQGKLEQPPSLRAFGLVSIRALKAGLIVSRGTVKVNNPKARRANVGLWEKIK